MKPILVLYATREGQTHDIADYVAAALRKRSQAAEICDAKTFAEPSELSNFHAAILAASVHAGRHETEMESFVKRHRTELDLLPTAFLSVSLSEAGAEDRAASSEQRSKSAADVERMMEDFFVRTGWRPRRVCPVAGALAYTRYGILVRFVMKRIARKAGGSTDTSRDHVYTDWEALDRFVDDFLAADSHSGLAVVPRTHSTD